MADTKRLSKQEVVEELKKEFNNDALAADVIATKYLLKDGTDFLEGSFKEMARRMAREIWSYSKGYEKWIKSEDFIFELIYSRKIIFGGRVNAGLGSKELISLSNCFVIKGPEDSYEDIMRTDCEQVQLMKRGGGVGFCLDGIRPRGSKVNNAAKFSTGAASFMSRYSNTTEEVAQDGRRGALMLMLDIEHPDAEEFITKKQTPGVVTGANVSVKVSDKFILEQNTENVRKLNLVAEAMWKSAEPGIIFWDTMSKNPWNAIGKPVVGTNPCGEVPLPENDSCRLLHANAYAVYFIPSVMENSDNYDNELYKLVFITNVLNDIIVDIEIDKIRNILKAVPKKSIEYNLWDKIRKNAITYRNIGVGMTGIADAIHFRGFEYTNEAEHRRLAVILKKASYEASIEMAKEFGGFPACEIDLLLPFVEGFVSKEHLEMFKKYGKRNITNNTLAPVGSGSLITQTTSGLEPLFEPFYKRKTRINGEWEEYLVVHNPLITWARMNGIDMNISSEESVREAFVQSPWESARSIDPRKKIKIQSIWQNYIDNSISVTYNLPKEATVEEIRELINIAWVSGLKGFTVYREGSRDGVLKATSEDSKKAIMNSRPNELPCDIHSMKVLGENWTVIIGLLDDRPYEIFALKANNITIKEGKGKLIKTIGEKTTYDFVSDCVDISDLISHYSTGNEQVLTKLVSRSLRMGIPINSICNDFNKVEAVIGTFENVLLRVLSKYNKDEITGEYIKCVSCQ